MPPPRLFSPPLTTSDRMPTTHRLGTHLSFSYFHSPVDHLGARRNKGVSVMMRCPFPTFVWRCMGRGGSVLWICSFIRPRADERQGVVKGNPENLVLPSTLLSFHTHDLAHTHGSAAPSYLCDAAGSLSVAREPWREKERETKTREPVQGASNSSEEYRLSACCFSDASAVYLICEHEMTFFSRNVSHPRVHRHSNPMHVDATDFALPRLLLPGFPLRMVWWRQLH